MSEDGISCSIVGEGVDPEDMLLRLRDHRPVVDRTIRRILLDPASYHRGERIRGRGTMPRERVRRGDGTYDVLVWGDDSAGYDLRVGRTKGLIKVTTPRPQAPAPREDTHDRVAEEHASHVLDVPVRRSLEEL